MASSSSHGRRSSTHYLLEAALSGNLKLIKKFQQENGNEEGLTKESLMKVKDSKGRGVLHYAASGGKTHVCKYLVEQLKLDVNVQDDDGDTPLHKAILEGQYLTSVYLLDHDAQPTMTGHKGVTALHYAAEKGRKDILRLLLSKGVEVDAPSLRGTPLQCAAASGMKDAVKILLDHGANPNSVSHHMYTPLIVAMLSNSVECVRLLLKAGADPNLSSRGATPLMLAASENDTEMIKCLLKAKADPNIPDFYDQTPIEIAALNGNHADVMALFPATNRIPSIPDWSCHGILEYVWSDEAKRQRKLKIEEKFLEAKQNGEEAFKRKDYLDAIYWYSLAIDAKPLDAAVLSNRSLCWARLNEGDNALTDAKSCIMLKKDWPKGHYRAGVAYKILRDNQRAVEAFRRALMLDPRNKELQDAYREAMADFRAEVMGSLGYSYEDYADSDDDLRIILENMALAD